MQNIKHHTYYTIIGSCLGILFALLYGFLGAKVDEAKTLCYVIAGLSTLSLIFALLDLIVNARREKQIGKLIYLSAAGAGIIVISGILDLNMPTVERTSWDFFIVVTGLALIVTGLIGLGRGALAIITYRANKIIDENWNEFAEEANIQEKVVYKEMDDDNVIEVDAVDVEDKK